MTVCAVWLARDFLRRTGRPIDIPPCPCPATDCPPIEEIAMTEPSCQCVEVEGDEFCPVHPGATALCDKCGRPAYDGIFVVVCRHVLDDDFDEDDEGNRVPRIRITAAPPSKPGPTYHLCDQPSCTSGYALCAPCATNL